jgi:hypothetical protein
MTSSDSVEHTFPDDSHRSGLRSDFLLIATLSMHLSSRQEADFGFWAVTANPEIGGKWGHFQLAGNSGTTPSPDHRAYASNMQLQG